MSRKTLIRKEYKGKWEGRAPLSPDGVRQLVNQGVAINVECSDTRIFPDEEYRQAGACMVDSCEDGEVVLGIKEPPLDVVRPGQIHLAFSHTIKGQSYNMDLLQTFLDQKATLIDYETIKDVNGKRLIAFGRYAGIAGAIDTFHVAGIKQRQMGKTTVLNKIGMTHTYKTIDALRHALQEIFPGPDDNLRILIVGAGNVGKGCEEVCHWLGLSPIEPDVILAGPPDGSWYCVLKTSDIVARKDGSPFNRADYGQFGAERYESTFHRYLGKFDILLQTPYWEEMYPRQLPRDLMASHRDLLPIVIGDISCDINGSLACTFKESSIEEPAFTYFPGEHRIEDGIMEGGPAVMSIGHLPCELSVDATLHFSEILVRYLPQIIAMDLKKPIEESGLSRELREATIVYRGQLTEPYRYLQEFLK